jgi:hypothetical protein
MHVMITGRITVRENEPGDGPMSPSRWVETDWGKEKGDTVID